MSGKEPLWSLAAAVVTLWGPTEIWDCGQQRWRQAWNYDLIICHYFWTAFLSLSLKMRPPALRSSWISMNFLNSLLNSKGVDQFDLILLTHHHAENKNIYTLCYNWKGLLFYAIIAQLFSISQHFSRTDDGSVINSRNLNLLTSSASSAHVIILMACNVSLRYM